MSPGLGPCFKPLAADSGRAAYTDATLSFPRMDLHLKNFSNRRAQTFVPSGILTSS